MYLIVPVLMQRSIFQTNKGPSDGKLSLVGAEQFVYGVL